MTSSTVFYVCPTPEGGWSVFGSDVAPALSKFYFRQEAVEYACRAAEQSDLGEVQVLGWDGGVEEVRGCASATGDRPAFRRAITRRATMAKQLA